MIIRNLYSLFCGSELQNGRSDCAPDVIEEKEHIVIVPEKFKDDVERLCKYCGVEFRRHRLGFFVLSVRFFGV